MFPLIKANKAGFSVRAVFCPIICLISLLQVHVPVVQAADGTLTLETAVKAAQLNDPWLAGNRHSQDAVESKSVAAGTLPDPQISFGLANLPTDTFDFNQEPMTQIKVGVTQMIPRGDSLAIKQKQLQTLAGQFPFQRQERRAKIVVMVGKLWLDAYNAQESINLIEKDRPLFLQLADIAEASYSTALGKTQQQDIIRAQLELTRLDDRLTAIKEKQESLMEKLSGWLSEYFRERYGASMTQPSWSSLELDKHLPNITLLQKSLYQPKREVDPQKLYEFFARHPSVRALDQEIEASKLGVDLARENYKPAWGINASYAYRGENPSGKDFADFVSVGVSFDLPFFTKNRQDKELQSSVSQSEAVKTKKWLMVRNMIADFEKTRAQLNRLNERQELYREKLLPQMHDQAEASLSGYTNDTNDFAEVVRSRIAELNAKIDSLNIDVARQKAIIDLNYFFMENADDIIAANSPAGEIK